VYPHTYSYLVDTHYRSRQSRQLLTSIFELVAVGARGYWWRWRVG